MFNNIPRVKRNGVWQWCTVRFVGNNIQIQNVHKVEHKTSRMSDMLEGIYHEEPISNFKKNLLLFAMNNHKINYKIFNIKKKLYDRQRTIWVFALAISISLAYFFTNAYFNNALMDWMNKNSYAHTFIMFLTLAGFINIFFPFTIQKPITQKDIIETAVKTIEEKKREDEENERIERMSQF